MGITTFEEVLSVTTAKEVAFATQNGHGTEPETETPGRPVAGAVRA